VALLTPPGRGALSVVGVAGPGAVAIVSKLFSPRGRTPLAERPAGGVAFGTWRSEASGATEDLVVVRRGDEELEVHCHGGLAAVESVISALERLGCRRQPWTAWLLAGGARRIGVEAHEALAAAGGPKAAKILSRQLAGGLEEAVGRVESLLRASRVADAHAAIDRLVRASRIGLRLTSPWRVVIAGEANVGKSSLANALAGHDRCIVSPEAGTTRDLLETRIVIDGWEIDLVDTAGQRDRHALAAVGSVELAGIDRAVAACRDADLVVRVCDGSTRAPRMPAAPGELPVFTKADLAAAIPQQHAGAVWTSAVTGRGIDDLAARIVRRLVPEEQDDPTLLAGGVPFTARQVRLIESLRPS